jgi:hypothetical protein
MAVSDDCKTCFNDYYNVEGKCILKPHKLLESCKSYDYQNHICLECEEGFVLDEFEPVAFCGWNRREDDKVTVIETSIPQWSNQ